MGGRGKITNGQIEAPVTSWHLISLSQKNVLNTFLIKGNKFYCLETCQYHHQWSFCYNLKYTNLSFNVVFYSPTQLSHILQCEALGGLNILQVKQNLSLKVCPFIDISFTLGGGLYV